MFIEELQNNNYTTNTKGGLYYNTSYNANLDLFSMVLRFKDENEIKRIFKHAYIENKELTTANILYNLDIRGGKGERRAFKELFKNLCFRNKELALKVMNYIPKLGRYDYLLEAFKTPLWDDAVALIKMQLESDIKSDNPSLLAKWMPSLRTHNTNNYVAKVLCKALGYEEKEYRKVLSTLRTNINIVEKNLTTSNYGNIDYSKVPSKAMNKYLNVFTQKDSDRYQEYLEAVRSGESKINAGVLAPYDIIKSIFKGRNSNALNEMWNAQKDYVNGIEKNVLVVADVSGSMMSYNMLPLSSSIGLAIYLAERNKGIFHNKFLNFSSNPTFQEIKGETIFEKVDSLDMANWNMNTDIDKAMELILTASTKSKKEECPSHLVIISDMEFDACTNKKTNFQNWKDKYAEAGLEMPKIVFWNVAGNSAGLPVTKNENDVSMISGFSPAIFKGILNIEKYNPVDVMLEVLNPYLKMVNEG